MMPPNPGEVFVAIHDDAIACITKCGACDTQFDYTLKFRSKIVRQQMTDQEWVREAISRMLKNHECEAIPVMPWPSGAPVEDFFRFGARMDEPMKGKRFMFLGENARA